MRFRSIVLCATAAAFGCAGWGQSIHGNLPHHNLTTGRFTIERDSVDPETTFTTYTGEIVFKLTVTIKSSISTSTAIYCLGDADVSDTSGVYHDEEAVVVAARSGSSATCTVTVPYSWALSDASSDAVSLEYSVIAGNATTEQFDRASDHGLVSIKVPANGATTTETEAVTI